MKTKKPVVPEEVSLKNGLKTHCPQGHEYTPENTKMFRGRRYCRACAAEYAKRHYHDVVAPTRALEPKKLRKPRANHAVDLPAYTLVDSTLLAKLMGGE